jgi:hypothetical protein
MIITIFKNSLVALTSSLILYHFVGNPISRMGNGDGSVLAALLFVGVLSTLKGDR